MKTHLKTHSGEKSNKYNQLIMTKPEENKWQCHKNQTVRFHRQLGIEREKPGMDFFAIAHISLDVQKVARKFRALSVIPAGQMPPKYCSEFPS